MNMNNITFCSGVFITGENCEHKNTCERFVRLNPSDEKQKTFGGIFPNEDYTCNYYWGLGDTECYAGYQGC